MTSETNIEPLPVARPGALPRSESGGWRKPAAWNAAAAFLTLLAPHLAFLVHNSYDLTSPEVAVVLLALAFAAVVVAAVAGTHASWRAVVFAVLLLPCIEAMLDLHGLGWRVRWIALVILVACMLLRRELPKVLVVVFTVFNATTLVKPALSGDHAPPTGSGSPDLPVLVHLVLDGHEGLDAFAGSTSGSELRDSLLSAQKLRGFRVYGGAYSRYLLTKDSLGNLFNFSAEPRRYAYFESEKSPKLLANAYFDTLLDQGFAVRVLQSDYLDFCAGSAVPPAACLSYPHAGLGAIEAVDASGPCKALLLERDVLLRTTIVMWAGNRFPPAMGLLKSLNVELCDGALPGWMFEQSRLQPLPSYPGLDVLDLLGREVRAARPGTAVFAHIILPHSPYLYRSDCSLRTASEWPAPGWLETGGPPAGVDVAAWAEERLNRYHEQVRCLHDRLSHVLDELERLPQPVWVVLHGDHGSRILPSQTGSLKLPDPTEFDLVHGFSAWFSVKAPHIPAGYDPSPFPLEELLLATMVERRLPSPGAEPTVFLERQDPKVLEALGIPEWTTLLERGGTGNLQRSLEAQQEMPGR